jgi:hypothetical protein
MTDTSTVPRAAWIVGFLLSFLVAGLTVIAFLATGPGTTLGFLLPMLLAAAAAFAFAVIWPGGSWRWGILLSSGFWVFFLIVFLAYLSTGQWDLLTFVRALSVGLAGLAGSTLATIIRPDRTRHN